MLLKPYKVNQLLQGSVHEHPLGIDTPYVSVIVLFQHSSQRVVPVQTENILPNVQLFPFEEHCKALLQGSGIQACVLQLLELEPEQFCVHPRLEFGLDPEEQLSEHPVELLGRDPEEQF